MATWIEAQKRPTLASHTATLGIGSVTALHVASADHYGAVRFLGFSLHSSYSLLVQAAQNSGTWLVSTLQAFGVGSGQAVEFLTYGRNMLFTLTNGASASMVRGYVHAVPVA